jgi:hypothetical protein
MPSSFHRGGAVANTEYPWISGYIGSDLRTHLQKRRFLAAGLLLIHVIAGCAADSTTLNSERIARKFGTYTIEVIESTENIRVSSLYSEGPAGPTSRTFAVVELPSQIDAAFATEHASIVAGGSIGAVFKSHGWGIGKYHQYIGEIAIDSKSIRIAALMHLELPETAAIHIYRFTISKDERTFDYATIAEVHHPDYLTATELRSIYGKQYSGAENRAEVRQVLDLVKSKL